jgi:hypothetical protein
MRASKKRDPHRIPARCGVSKQHALAESKDRRKRLPVPVIRTGRPATLELTGQKIDQILFG